MHWFASANKEVCEKTRDILKLRDKVFAFLIKEFKTVDERRLLDDKCDISSVLGVRGT